jgi:hypothetical protein
MIVIILPGTHWGIDVKVATLLVVVTFSAITGLQSA